MEYLADKAVETLISFVLNKLFEKLSSLEFLNIFGKKSIGDQLKQLNEKLEAASLLLNDAEERQLDEPNVKKWLDNLKHVIYRAQDLVDEIEYEALAKKSENEDRSEQEHESETNTRLQKRRKFSISLPFVSEFDKTVSGEVADILKDLNVLLDDEVSRGLNKEGTNKNSTSTGSPSKRQFDAWPPECRVHGRGADKEKIMKLLLSNEVWRGEIGVLPIVGMGGLGKTTLAQLIYDDSKLKEHGFELKAWVTVSTDFDVERIIKIILEGMVGSWITSGKEEPTELQGKLRETLRGKKFLIVLDDVWDENYKNWNVLKSIFEFGRHESRVIVTTRSRNVALVVNTGPDIDDLQLQPVSNDHCWRIFMDHVFDGDSNADQRLQQIGRALVNKCGGLPLAVISLAGLLRSKKNPQEWENILNSNVWERCHKIQTGEILPSALWLSYRYLPSCLKQCFTYCSIFRKDYEFGREETILLWMAQGFLQSDKKEKGMELEEVGDDYFDNLISRSLFQKSSVDKSKYVMHDLVHDLAIFVSGEFSVTLNHDKSSSRLHTSKTRHLSYVAHEDEEYLRDLDLSNKAMHLRTFIGRRHKSYTHSPGMFVEELLVAGSCLRVLSPIISSRRLLPNSISNLKHLRYLNLSWSDIEEIPCSICTLYNLQILLLSRCRHLKRLPNNMRRLMNLRHLDITDSSLVEMPPHMGDLKQLRKLSHFVLGQIDNGSSVKELGELQHLGGKLCISELQNVDNVEDVLKANLKDKKNLSELALEWWEGNNTDTIRRNEVLDALQPHTNIEKLTIFGYVCSSFPNWLGGYLFSNMVSIRLDTNKYCEFLPPLGQLPSLQDLFIRSFYGVKKIGAEFYGNIPSKTTPFQSLESLSFENMPNWKEWLVTGNVGESGCFPRLKRLILDGCPNVIGSLPDSHTIEELMIRDSYQFIKFLPLNYYPMLDVLTLCNCDFIKSLPLDYFPRLKKVELARCEKLESLTFSQESGTAVLQCLSSLELYNCKNLRSLPQHMYSLLPSLSNLEIYSCPEIKSFPEGGLPLNLSELRIYGCKELVAQNGHWHLERLTSLKSLSISGCDVVFDTFPKGLLPISLTFLSLYQFPHLKSLNSRAFEHMASLHTLWLSECKELEFLPEQVLRTSLRSLQMSWCPLLNRRYRRGEGEDWDKVSHIPDLVGVDPRQ